MTTVTDSIIPLTYSCFMGVFGRAVRSDHITGASTHINELSGVVIGAAIKIHRGLGPGLLESAYEACLSHELKAHGLHVERQKAVPLIYEGVQMDCGFRADLVVEGRLVVELKCKDALHPVDYSQLLSHLRLLGLQVGLLINFHVNVLKDGITRMVNDYREE